MANVAAIYELQNSVNINLTADSLFHELTKNNLLRSFEYSQKVYSLLKENGIKTPFDEVSRVFNNSHNDHVEHTNKELFSCCQDMEKYLKTLPDSLSNEIEKPNFETNTLSNTVDEVENGITHTKNNMNTRLKNVFEKSFTGENGHNTKESTGMGLFLVKKMCHQLGHEVKIESKYLKYTKVTIRIYKNTFYSVLK